MGSETPSSLLKSRRHTFAFYYSLLAVFLLTFHHTPWLHSTCSDEAFCSQWERRGGGGELLCKLGLGVGFLVKWKDRHFSKLVSTLDIQFSHYILGFFSVPRTVPNGDAKLPLSLLLFWRGSSNSDGLVHRLWQLQRKKERGKLLANDDLSPGWPKKSSMIAKVNATHHIVQAERLAGAGYKQTKSTPSSLF